MGKMIGIKMESRLLLEKELELGISKDLRDGSQKRERSIPNGLNIIVRIVYVYCSIIITCFKLLVRTRFSFYIEPGSDTNM